MRQHVLTVVVCSILFCSAPGALAHEGHDHDVPSGLWPSHTRNEIVLFDAPRAQPLGPQTVQLDRRITSWLKSDGTMGSSTNTAINNVVSTVLADVNTIAYDSDYVYIRTSGIPSHAVGPFGGNPSVPGDVDATYHVTLNPTPETGTRTSAAYSLGNIGVMVNGVGIFGPWDSTFWRPQQNTLSNPGQQQPPGGANWRVNALWRRASGMDDARGHPAPMNNQTNPDGSTKGRYHYHMFPESLVEQIDPGNTGAKGSPIIGFAYDGYAIVGPYAYEEQGDGSLVPIQMTSSYGLISDRADLGVTPAPSEGDYALGSFIEDFEYKPGTGNLNAFNMAFVKFDGEGRAVLTDETDPEGEWAYFLTLDVINAISGNDTTLDGDVAWPYIIGPEFYGVFDAPGNQIVVPNDVTFYFDFANGLPADLDADGDVDDADFGISFAAFSGPGVATSNPDADLDNDGDVDDADFGLAFAAFTGPGGTSTVPEPTAAALLALSGLALVRRRERRGYG